MKKLFTLSFLTLASSLLTVNAQSGIISTIGGDAAMGYNGDNRQATTADLNNDNGVAVDAAGNVYIADSQNNRIRKIATTGIITTIAGNGISNFSGDGGMATAAEISYPVIVRVDSLGNVYFSDNGNNVVRKVNTSGRISTVAGNAGLPAGYSGNGGQATAAEFNGVVGICLDKNLNLYVADQLNNVIRKVATNGIITTVAGKGPTFTGYTGDGGQATNAEMDQPLGVAVDNDGRMYICDYMNNVVRMVNTSGVISTFAGNGVNSFNNFSGPATSVEFSNPTGVSVDDKGHVYIADAGNAVIWQAFVTTNQIYVIAGIVDDGYSGDGGAATLAEVNYPFDAVPDKNNNVYIADLLNNRVRKITAGCAGDSVMAVSYNYPECPGGTDGYIVAFPSSNFAPYTYLWSNGNTTSADSVNVPAGTYTISVTDAFGCVGTGAVVITQPPAIVIDTFIYSICLGSDIKMSASATGGTGSLNFVWAFDSATTDTATVAPTSSQPYLVYVVDGNGCYDSASDYVNVKPLPIVNLNAESYSVCSTDTSDSLIGTPPGGTFTGPDLVGNIFNPSLAGAGIDTFYYSYKDTDGCSAVAMQTINVTVCSGIQALMMNGNKILVYPNPANNEFTVQLSSPNDAQLMTMYSVTGQQVYVHKFASAENSQLSVINTESFPAGVYFLKVILNDGTTLFQKVEIAK